MPPAMLPRRQPGRTEKNHSTRYAGDATDQTFDVEELNLVGQTPAFEKKQKVRVSFAAPGIAPSVSR
jgi:hypothetical protein